MFGWLSRCWGGMGVISQFQMARIRSVITDWKVPDDEDICVLIASFKGENPEIPREAALNVFLSRMETDDEKGNPIYLLKHLYILDQTVEEQTALDLISRYHSSQFFSFKTGSSIEISPIRELIAAYFLYVKKKASIYGEFDPRFFINSKNQRVKFIEETETTDIFVLVDKCLQLQKAIKEVSDKYKGRNKSVQLIQIIFTLILKTYIFCYTIVALCVKTLFKRINLLARVELQRMYKFVQYFNNVYTRNFVDLVESNKEVQVQIYLYSKAFKSFKYSELILIDKNFMVYLDNLSKRQEEVKLINTDLLNFDQENSIRQIPEYITKRLSQDIKVAYRLRKLYELEQNEDADQSPEHFFSFKNVFSADYMSQYEESVRNAFNLQQNLKLSKKSSQSLDSSCNSSVLRNRRKAEFSQKDNDVKFDDKVWNHWENVYAM